MRRLQSGRGWAQGTVGGKGPWGAATRHSRVELVVHPLAATVATASRSDFRSPRSLRLGSGHFRLLREGTAERWRVGRVGSGYRGSPSSCAEALRFGGIKSGLGSCPGPCSCLPPARPPCLAEGVLNASRGGLREGQLRVAERAGSCYKSRLYLQLGCAILNCLLTSLTLFLWY